MLSGISLSTDVSTIHTKGNTIGELALLPFCPLTIYIFADEILGPAVTNN